MSRPRLRKTDGSVIIMETIANMVVFFPDDLHLSLQLWPAVLVF